jgi:hypothetical protein
MNLMLKKSTAVLILLLCLAQSLTCTETSLIDQAADTFAEEAKTAQATCNNVKNSS